MGTLSLNVGGLVGCGTARLSLRRAGVRVRCVDCQQEEAGRQGVTRPRDTAVKRVRGK